MTEIKGTKKLDKMINNYVKKFGCTAELGSEFCYWHDDETVDYSFIIPVPSDEVWKEYVKKEFNFNLTNIFMFSLLHEIGHHYTMDFFTQTQQNKNDKMVDKIEKVLSESDDEKLDKTMYLKYFDLPMERIATKWAVNYYRKHRFSINRFYKKLNKELKKFYKINGLLD